MKTMSERKCLTRKEAADLLGVCTRTIDNELKAGNLGAIHVGRAVRIPWGELQRYMQIRAVVSGA